MNEIKSLADQLRSRMSKPDTPTSEKPAEAPVPEAAGKKKEKKPAAIPPIVDLLRAYDLTGHDNLAHIRFDGQTAQLLHHLKRATGAEINKVVAYAVRDFLDKHPELKTIVKQHLQKLEL